MTKPRLTRRHITLMQAILGDALTILEYERPEYADLKARRCLDKNGRITPLGERLLRRLNRSFPIPF